MFNSAPRRIVYVYRVWQKIFAKLHNNNIEYIRSINQILMDGSSFKSDTPMFLVPDDLMDEILNNKKPAALFIQVLQLENDFIFVTESFQARKGYAGHLAKQPVHDFGKSACNTQQIKCLVRQVGLPHLEIAFRKTIKFPYGFLVIGLHPSGPEVLRL